MKSWILTILAAVFLCAAPCAHAAPEQAAAGPKAAAPVANKPAAVKDRVTNVSVVLEGTDSIGARLGTRLKEMFNSSSLFKLTEADAPKLKVIVTTAPEFPTRPAFGSVYSVCWVYSQGDSYLPFLLSRECGTVSGESLEALVARLVERTDGVSVKYASLWKK